MPAPHISLKAVSVLFLFLLSTAFGQNARTVAEQGDWDISIWAAGETGEENTNSFAESQIWTAGIFIGRTVTGEHLKGWRRGSLEYAFDLVPVFATSGNQHNHGIGFEPVILRWNSALHTSRLSPYIELAGGGLFTGSNLPPGNTSNFNFTAKGGAGIYVWTRRRQYLDVGCRWSHISNANLGVNNTEFNGVQVSLAYHWRK